MAKADSTLIYRYSALDGAKIDRAARTVPISFSSELPAMQRESGQNSHITGLNKGDVYIEILDHDPANVDLSQLNNRGAFLDEHDDKDQIGVVEKAEVDAATRRGLALVKLSAHEKGMRRFAEMEANDRPHISAGYKYTKLIRSENLPNGRKALRFAWAGKEISSVAVPNDPTVGVARAYQDLPEVDSPALTKSERTELENLRRNKNMKTPEELAAEKATADAIAAAVATAEKKARSEAGQSALTAERDRVKNITRAADELIKDRPELKDQITGMVNEALGKEETYEAFQIRAMTGILNAKPAKKNDMKELGYDEKEIKSYSLVRAIQNCLQRKQSQPDPDTLEGDAHVKMSKLDLGLTTEGFLVPPDANISPRSLGRSDRGRMQRDLVANNFGNGGATVATELITPIIEILRNQMVCDRMGIRTMAGLSGNIVIPRQTAAATAYSVTETGALTTSTQVLDQIAMTPRRVGATNNYSRQLLLQSSIDVESFIRNDMLAVIALDWDRLILNGQGGASEPLGVMNTPGIGSVVFGAAATWANIVLFETTIAALNAPTNNRGFATTSTAKGRLKTLAKLLVGATTVAAEPLWGGPLGVGGVDGVMNGYMALDSQQIPNHQLVFGAWSDIILGLWGGMDVVLDPYSLAKNAEVVVTMNTFGDVAVRHPQSFCVSADSAAQ